MKVTKAQMSVNLIKWMNTWINEFEGGVNNDIFSGDEQQKVYLKIQQTRQIQDFKILNKQTKAFPGNTAQKLTKIICNVS